MLLIAAAITAGCSKERDSASAAQVKHEPQSYTETTVIPAGTNIVASLETRLVTDANSTGDPFTARTIDAVIVDGKTVIPAGARIQGTLQDVQASGKISGRARMTLAFQRIDDAKGNAHPISAVPLTLQAASKTRGDVEKIAAGGVLGAIIGGIAGGKKGAVIGGGAGAGAGTVLMLATKGKEVELNPGDRLNVSLTAPTSISRVVQR